VDSTGLETRHASFHYRYRYSRRYQESYQALHAGRSPKEEHVRPKHPKLSVVVHTASHLIAGALPTWGPSNDAPLLPEVLTQAEKLLHFTAAVADAGYDSEANHRTSREELRIEETAIPLNPRTCGPRGPRAPYRRQMYTAFPRQLYQERRQVESVFSQQKRRLGSALTSRSCAAQQSEMVLRVLTHNLLILHCGSVPPFNRADDTRRVRGQFTAACRITGVSCSSSPAYCCTVSVSSIQRPRSKRTVQVKSWRTRSPVSRASSTTERIW